MEPNQMPSPDQTPASPGAPGQVVTPGTAPSPTVTASPPPAVFPADGRPMAVATGMSQPTPAAALAGTDNPKKSLFNRLGGKKLAVAAVIFLVLLGGSSGAYYGYVLPNKPENVLAKAFSNSLSQHQFTTEGTLNITSGGVSGKLEYNSAVNEDSHSTDTKFNATISGVNIPLELITTKGNAYFKVGDLSSLQGLLSPYLGSSPDIKAMEDKIVKDVTSQWYVVDSTLIKEAKLSCLSDWPAAFTSADINSLKSAYHKNQFAKIASHSADTISGQAAVKYEINVNDDQLAKYDLNNTPYFKNLVSCLKQADPSASLDLSSSKDGDTTPITLWVDKSSKRIIKYATHSTAQDKKDDVTGDLTGTIKYGSVEISPPQNAKPVINLLGDLNLSGLSGSSDNSLGVIPGSGSADTERKTDINALQGHIEAYYADTGYYPTLAQLNSASWRAINMKGLDDSALKDPAGTSSVLTAAPAAHVYSYKVLPAGCDNTITKCTSYTLTATLDGGGAYVKQSLSSSDTSGGAPALHG